MSIQRKKVGKPTIYKARTIQPEFMGPDLLCEVDGMELQGFFVDTPSAIAAGERHIDAEEKAAAEKKK